jgi:hypothetical protein
MAKATTRLITEEAAKNLPGLGGSGPDRDPMLWGKLSYADLGWTWWVSEYDPHLGIAYGLLDAYECDWGAFRLDDLEAAKGKQGSRVERDDSFKPLRFSKLREELRGMGKRI